MRVALLMCVLAGKTGALATWLAGGSLWVVAALFFGPSLVLLYHALIPNAQGLGHVHTRFLTNRREVWLTIDDGPDAEDTPRMLAGLAQEGARATFFLIGERAAKWPDLVQAIIAAGHEVGHHTQTHPAATFWFARPARIRRELDLALEVFAAGGIRPRWFRAPAGIKNWFLEPALRTRGLSLVGWSLRSWDTMRHEPGAVVEDVMRKVQPGSIIVIHEGMRRHPRVQQQVLAHLLVALRRAGYSCVIPRPEQLR